MKTGRYVALVLAASVPLVLGFAGSASAAGSNTGGAFGVQVTVLGQTIVPPTPIVNFPPGGQRGLLNVGQAGANAAGVQVSSNGDNNGNVASSAGIIGASNTNGSTFAASGLTSSCTSSPSGSSGTTGVVNGSTAAGPVANNPPPNTSIPLLIGTQTINEQQQSPSGIRVRAVHSSTPVSDVILSESDCGVAIVGAANAAAATATAAATAAMPSLAG